MDTPVEIPSSPIPGQLMALLRQALTAGGAYLAGRGLLTDSDIAVIIPAIVALAGIVWGQFATRKNAQKAAIAAEAAPNTKAVTV